MRFAALLTQQFLALVIRFQEEADGASHHASTALVPDRYIADAVLGMAVVGVVIWLVRLIKLYKHRSRYPLRKAEIQEIRRRFLGAA